MLVLLNRDWKGYKAGRLIDPTDGAAEILIRRGIVSEIEALTVEPDGTMTAEARKKKEPKGKK